jgi:hypothetical protein
MLSYILSQLIRREVLVWRQLRHPRILKLLGIEKPTNTQLSVVSIRLESESLVNFVKLRKKNGTLPMSCRDRNILVSNASHNDHCLNLELVERYRGGSRLSTS